MLVIAGFRQLPEGLSSEQKLDDGLLPDSIIIVLGRP
jgi:hypothetical protein